MAGNIITDEDGAAAEVNLDSGHYRQPNEDLTADEILNDKNKSPEEKDKLLDALYRNSNIMSELCSHKLSELTHEKINEDGRRTPHLNFQFINPNIWS